MMPAEVENMADGKTKEIMAILKLRCETSNCVEERLLCDNCELVHESITRFGVNVLGYD